MRLLTLAALLSGLVVGPGHSRAQNSGPERDRWQRPAEVMDALGVMRGSVVADVGCGSGYFTFHLAGRVGAEGKVMAVDVKDDVLAEIRKKAKKQGLTQIEAIQGSGDDPHLPGGTADVALIVNAYHEMRQYDAMLQGVYRALKPGGLLGLIDAEAKPGRLREDYYSEHRMPEATEREDALRNGFRFLRQPPGFVRTDDARKFYFLIFQKP